MGLSPTTYLVYGIHIPGSEIMEMVKRKYTENPAEYSKWKFEEIRDDVWEDFIADVWDNNKNDITMHHTSQWGNETLEQQCSEDSGFWLLTKNQEFFADYNTDLLEAKETTIIPTDWNVDIKKFCEENGFTYSEPKWHQFTQMC